MPLRTTLLLLLIALPVWGQQIAIPRIDQMPDQPTPYLMRDWARVARGYDSLVFDFSRTGAYLPLIERDETPVNYPDQPSFGLHTVVGTPYPDNHEGINALPALIGATLVGLDKSNQYGENWVVQAREWFNRRPGENVYLNGKVTSSGNDWWYDVMPNVFFYQLYDLYPNTPAFATQLTTVADRWLEAVETMGGQEAPWQQPNMNYRAWRLASMTPLTSGVIEPEAAGALGWLLYNAYVETGEERYRKGAEWCLEFLSGLTNNPSYELQLPYGVYAAARMNAELGTAYDVEKLMNWCFNVGPLRSWGAITGTWGGYEVSGLIGEVSSNDYAFAMNGYEQAGALVPLVRYDDRFARAIGKWMLNLANASRLFYAPYLPAEQQDNEDWAQQYDPKGYIGYEAIRRQKNGQSPYATGDAMDGGWGATNLTLYGSSHVGILGGIVDTTEVPMILRLDARRTDYFQKDAYPTYLYYNPYTTAQTVSIDVGAGQYRLYDAVSNQFVVENASGMTALPLPANAAVVLVVVPGTGTETVVGHRRLVNGIVIDYQNGESVANVPPRIKALASADSVVAQGDSALFYCTAEDQDGDSLTYTWSATGGTFQGSGAAVAWIAPDTSGTFTLTCTVSDGQGGTATAQDTIRVVPYISYAPVITRLHALPRKIGTGASATLICEATDLNPSDTLTFTWSAPEGTFAGSGDTVTWTAPATPGNYVLTCFVDDGYGNTVADSLDVMVRDLSATPTGNLVAWYLFNGNADDASGYGNDGTVSGPRLTDDRFGNTQQAYFFDGINDVITVPSSESLNFQDAITVSFWMRLDRFYDREMHPISHGSWQNRWKTSIGANRLRWTVKTSMTTKDLDSEDSLDLSRWYHVVTTYDGADYEIWLDGELNAFTAVTGEILTTPLSLTIGQVLPGESGFNFRGALDDIRIYNYALSPDAIVALNLDSTITSAEGGPNFDGYQLAGPVPNPVLHEASVQFQLPQRQHITLNLYNAVGAEVATLVDGWYERGTHTLRWRPNALPGGLYFYRLETAGGFAATRKVLLQKP
ncbi:Concanavalin A-like lectin/glucanases superfamily protein [Catalinimonas alkaloidigena]|uniref:Concanavalin A-like lectin/glucanases superfamily protein n=1 Tax=Catalinimonas alkaloidigena TaxID=1075417 RepID=A0A1G9E9E2_9BACT|nr:LamG domain-containing protein [Catalinimonas alkaloidigena]SDK72760.1 Concanavalin A-like lectin/glucanases superfamily protein [Catalinimonas alkaloidigena]